MYKTFEGIASLYHDLYRTFEKSALKSTVKSLTGMKDVIRWIMKTQGVLDHSYNQYVNKIT